MAGKVAYVFPGQGAQKVGMGLDLYDAYPTAKAVFQQADVALKFPLSKICFEGPEEELKQTINAQPALATTSLAFLKVAQEVAGDKLPSPAFVAGHSLGEYTALAAAGVIDFATTVFLARERGRLMYEAGLKQPGTMAAVIGMDEVKLAEICQQTGSQIANINCPGQIVISGGKENVARAVEMVAAAGSRAIPLQVSGAFHTELMQSAYDGMAQVLSRLEFKEPKVPVVANTSARPLTTAREIKEELLYQLCHCVQWQRSVEYMINNGVSTFIEIGPGKVLTGLIKRINKEVNTINIGELQDIKNLS